jgi:hypothetical protein
MGYRCAKGKTPSQISITIQKYMYCHSRGDFNAKHTHWGSRLITNKGRELYKAVTDTGCEIISTGKPTYWPTDGGGEPLPDLNDFFVVKNISINYIKI